jgi:NAD(P)-dependent dehydrogenase (short-subunit alcohol dehydrogenase family)
MSDRSLRGQVALVTGGSRGLGSSIGKRLHELGMHVAVTSRSAKALGSATDRVRSRDAPGRLLVLPGDVTDLQSVASVVAATEHEFGGIDLLVNNAGRVESREVPVWEAAPEQWWDVVTTNLRGPSLFCRHVLPGMLARGTGRVVNINSLRGVRPQSTQTSYGVSKGALALLTESLAAGLSGTGVRAFDYSPCRVETELAQTLVNLGSMRAHGWTPVERAVSGVVAIAKGRLDALSGCFVHAEDDLEQLAERASEIIENDGRRMVLSQAFAGDPLSQRRISR